jgi:hypothetical protein
MSLALALLLLADPTSAALPTATPEEQLRDAHSKFDHADYADAAAVAKQLLSTGTLTRPQDQIEALRILGLSFFFTQQADGARKAFLDLLLLDPDYQLDAFYVPPNAIAFFESVRSDNQEVLDPIRQHRRTEAERLAEEARRLPPPTPPIVREVSPPKHLVVALLPLGAGQFQNGDPQLGYLLASSEILLLGINLGCLGWIESLRGPDLHYSGSNLTTANTLRGVQIASGSLAGLLWILGAVEAVSRMKAEPKNGENPPTSGAPAQLGARSRFGIALDAIPGGATARLALSF